MLWDDPKSSTSYGRLMLGRDSQSETTMALAIMEKPCTAEKNTCKHCDHYCHDEGSGFEIIAHPPNWGTWGRDRGGRSIIGEWGGRAGRGRGCGPGRKSAHAATTQSEQAINHGSVVETARVNIPRLSSEQVKWPLSLINVPKGWYEKLSGKTTWIIDCGATCHMTYDLKLLAEIKNIRPVAISLLNNAHASVSYTHLTLPTKRIV